MFTKKTLGLWLILTTIASAQVTSYASEKNAGRQSTGSFHVIVMDPLAAPLSCPCVEGYAQRKYEVLAAHLKAKLGREVTLTFAEALSKGLNETKQQADLIIGKSSVVAADADAAKLAVTPIAALSGKDGSTQQHGLIVVAKDDPAKTVADLNGYQIIFGPSECDEKHSAAIELLTSAAVKIPKTLSIDAACSDGACKVIELGSKGQVAAVISSYAAPLLEGCGTIKKGDLRVVGKTKDVPFVWAFANNNLSTAEREQVTEALFAVIESPKVMTALETLIGFVPIEDSTVASKKK